MISIVFATVTTCCIATASVIGGGLGRRGVDSRIVLWVAQSVGAILAVPLLLVPGREFALVDLWWGLVAGVLSTIGTVTNWRALAQGPMSIVAPLIGVMIGFVPVVVGIALDDHISIVSTLAFAIGFASIVLSTPRSSDRDATGSSRWSSNGKAIFAGTCIGIQLVVMGLASSSGVAMLFALRITTVAMLSPIAVGKLRRDLPYMWLASIGGLFLVGDLSYLVATSKGDLSVVGIVVSLNPAVVVIIARLVLKERLTRRQSIGLLGALSSIVLFSIATPR